MMQACEATTMKVKSVEEFLINVLTNDTKDIDKSKAPSISSFQQQLLHLLDDGLNEIEGENLFLDLISNGEIELVKFMLQHSPDYATISFNEPIILAACTGNYEMFKLLFDCENTDPSYRHDECLKKAIEDRDLEIFKLLITDERVDPITCLNDWVYLGSLNTFVSVNFFNSLNNVIFDELTIMFNRNIVELLLRNKKHLNNERTRFVATIKNNANNLIEFNINNSETCISLLYSKYDDFLPLLHIDDIRRIIMSMAYANEVVSIGFNYGDISKVEKLFVLLQ